MLNNVMPQRGVFFSLLTSHTDRMVAAANATLRLISVPSVRKPVPNNGMLFFRPAPA